MFLLIPVIFPGMHQSQSHNSAPKSAIMVNLVLGIISKLNYIWTYPHNIVTLGFYSNHNIMEVSSDMINFPKFPFTRIQGFPFIL